jgi:hypothetical protein
MKATTNKDIDPRSQPEASYQTGVGEFNLDGQTIRRSEQD